MSNTVAPQEGSSDEVDLVLASPAISPSTPFEL